MIPVPPHHRSVQIVLRQGNDTVVARLELPYEFYRPCRTLIDMHGGKVEAEDFGARVELCLRISEEQLEKLRGAVQEATSGRVSVEQVS